MPTRPHFQTDSVQDIKRFQPQVFSSVKVSTRTMAKRSPFSHISLLVASLLSVVVAFASGNDDIDLSSMTLWSKNNVKPLPTFFFRSIAGNPSVAANYTANLTAEGRVFTALGSCSDLCSIGPLAPQVQLAIAYIRTSPPDTPKAGSSRAVIEEMNDHKVHSFISLAVAQNGVFRGLQLTDAVPLRVFVNDFGSLLFPKTLFDFTKYMAKDYADKLQWDFDELTLTTPALQQQLSLVNMGRSPDFKNWVKTNTLLPLYNNTNERKLLYIKCTLEKARRRRNFLKLRVFHLFVSEGDDVASPWQTWLLAQYNNVNSLDEIETKFTSLQIVNLKQTLEYTLDTYRLRTLDVLGRLYLHTIPTICHACWVNNSIPIAGGEVCKFCPLYDQYVYPCSMIRSAVRNTKECRHDVDTSLDVNK